MRSSNRKALRIFLNNTVKVALSKLVLGALALFCVMLFACVAEGSLPVLPALVLGFAALLGMNVCCGVILPAQEPTPTVVSARPRPAYVPAHPAVSLRVVRGGRAA